MPAALSAEAQIDNGIRELNCAAQSFAAISGIMSNSRLANGLSGKKNFEHHDAERLLLVLAEMRELQDFHQVPIDWSDTETVRTALDEHREKKKVFAEVHRVCSASFLLTREEIVRR
jgi:hypothetical protein